MKRKQVTTVSKPESSVRSVADSVILLHEFRLSTDSVVLLDIPSIPSVAASSVIN